MPCSGCSALHGVNHNLKKKIYLTSSCIFLSSELLQVFFRRAVLFGNQYLETPNICNVDSGMLISQKMQGFSLWSVFNEPKRFLGHFVTTESFISRHMFWFNFRIHIPYSSIQ